MPNRDEQELCLVDIGVPAMASAVWLVEHAPAELADLVEVARTNGPITRVWAISKTMRFDLQIESPALVTEITDGFLIIE